MLSGRRATLAVALSFLRGHMKTVVYVDGYNLYYGLLRRANLKWLDLVSLFDNHVLDPQSELIEVRYYTAPVLGRMCDDPASPQRQRQYLQALKTLHNDRLKIIEGKIVAATPHQRLVNPLPELPDLKRIQVYDFKEKKTDVGLATDLLTGAWSNSFEQAVLCSNDTDFEPALATVRRDHPKIRLGLVAPVARGESRYISGDLKRHVHWSKTLSLVHVGNSQLPEKIPGTNIRRPDTW